MHKFTFLSLVCLSSPAWAGDCEFYNFPNRVRPLFSQNSDQNKKHVLASDSNKQISSVWIKDGFYAILFDHALYQGTALYLYGTGLSFAKNVWDQNQSSLAAGGAVFNLAGFDFDNKASSVICLKD